METKIEELYELISKQKEIAGLNFFGAFRDGYIAALDVVNVWAKAHEVKCVECKIPLSEEERADGDICNTCYGRLQKERNAESSENR